MTNPSNYFYCFLFECAKSKFEYLLEAEMFEGFTLFVAGCQVTHLADS
jgi:hypothetical protein